MRPNINVFVYRPRQVILAKERPRKNTRHFEVLSPIQSKLLGLMVIAVLVIGLGLTQSLHVRIVELQTEVDQLQTSNTVIANENNRLVADGGQVASKAQVVALAQKRLKLFAPAQGQVHRMWTNNDKTPQVQSFNSIGL